MLCFKMTVEDNRPSLLSDIQGYVYGSSKIQQKCLQMFNKGNLTDSLCSPKVVEEHYLPFWFICLSPMR